MTKSRLISAFLLLLSCVACRHKGIDWVGNHSYRRALISFNTEHELGSARFSVVPTNERGRYLVTDLNAKCSMILASNKNTLSGRDVQCAFANDSVLRGFERVYRFIHFDFNEGSVLGLFGNRGSGQDKDVLLEDDFELSKTMGNRLRFRGSLSNTAQTSPELAPCTARMSEREGETDIILEGGRTVFFPGFRCRLEVQRDERGGYSASDAPCVPDTAGISFTDVGISERVITSFKYDPNAKRLAYAARTRALMRARDLLPGKLGTWCSEFSGSAAMQ